LKTHASVDSGYMAGEVVWWGGGMDGWMDALSEMHNGFYAHMAVYV